MSDSKHDSDAISRLLEVMAELRGEQGCPWDREQNHATLVPYLIEEAFELVEAFDKYCVEAAADA